MKSAKLHLAEDMSRVVAVVLGGGRGTRLYPLTAMRAKPAVPLCGRYRLVDIPLSNCIHSGVNQIFVLTQFNSASLNRHIIHSYKFDNFSDGFVEILAAEQTMENRDWYQGTADAIRKQFRHVKYTQAEHCLILSGDQLYRMDYRNLMQTHLEAGADITVAALPVTRDAAPRLGILSVRKNGRIVDFVEKPSTDEDLDRLRTPSQLLVEGGLNAASGEYLASMGVYLFRMEVLEEILFARLDWVDFGKHVIPLSLANRKVFAHLFGGFWEDIGTVRSYYDVSMQIASADPPFEFHDPRYLIFTHPRYLPGSRLHGAIVEDSIVCEGCRILRAEISNSIIGVRTMVYPGAKINRSIVLGADFYEGETPPGEIPIGIGRDAKITGAIIDKNARIGQRVVISGSHKLRDADGPGYAIRDGIVVVMKNATIPDGTVVG